jgi:hypothetical protein
LKALRKILQKFVGFCLGIWRRSVQRESLRRSYWKAFLLFSISFRYKRTVRDSIPGPQTWTVGYRKTHRHIGERERKGRHLKLHRHHHHHNHHRSFTSNSSWIHFVLTEPRQIQSWLDVFASETLGQPVYLPDKSAVFNFLNCNFVNCDFYLFLLQFIALLIRWAWMFDSFTFEVNSMFWNEMVPFGIRWSWKLSDCNFKLMIWDGLEVGICFVDIDLFYDYFAHGNLEILTSKSESKVFIYLFIFFFFCKSLL